MLAAMKTRKMVVLVCGGRSYNRIIRLWETLDMFAARWPITELRHGAAKGADEMAGWWAEINDVPCRPFPADWSRGKVAGFERNAAMIADGLVDAVVAFPGGVGSRMMVDLARKKAIQTFVIDKTEWI